MPFTPMHAIAAIGLHRFAKALPLPVLVVGAMSPDFEYGGMDAIILLANGWSIASIRDVRKSRLPTR